jgi:hypothetical protein
MWCDEHVRIRLRHFVSRFATISVHMSSVQLDEVFVAEAYMGKLMFQCLVSVTVYGRNMKLVSTECQLQNAYTNNHWQYCG